MKKIIYFVRNGRSSADDMKTIHDMTSDGTKATFSNGSCVQGFEDTCDAVYLSDDFPHIERWALMKGIEVLKPKKEEPAKPAAKTSRNQSK